MYTRVYNRVKEEKGWLRSYNLSPAFTYTPCTWSHEEAQFGVDSGEIKFWKKFNSAKFEVFLERVFFMGAGKDF